MVKRFDKATILELVLRALEETVAAAHGNATYFEKEAAGYPSAMESHSDTNRSQNQHMAEGARQNALRLGEGLGELSILPKGWDETVHTKVQRLSIIETLDDHGERLLAFIVPGKASATIEYRASPESEPFEIVAVPEEAPLGKALLDQGVGSKVVVGRRTHTLVWLQ